MTEPTHRSPIAQDDPSLRVVDQPTRTAGVVRPGATPVEHEQPEDWGWHGETGKWGRIGAVIALGFIALMLYGNEPLLSTGQIWAISIVTIGALILVWDWRRRKNAWRSR